MNKTRQKILIAVITGFLTGILGFVGFRFITYTSDNVHYHANFAMYVDGKREEFKSFTFYEEVQACSSDADNDPKHRTHMHNQQNDLIHVHAPAVTWGHFFSNIGYIVSDDVIKTDEGVFLETKAGKTPTFILNGEQVTGINNRVINSEDRLLVNYGNDNEQVLQERFETVPQTASEFNGKYDPGGCSGGEALTFLERLKIAVLGQ